MPRTRRKKSDTKIYHIVSRGINRQNIFEEPSDNQVFLQILSELRDKQAFTIFAWCLMSNHYHLLVKENQKTSDIFMKNLGIRYAYYFNVKYNRVGHVFQDRYKCVPVTDDKQLLATCRYIHMNPVKAGICKQPEEYDLSSYREYLFVAKDSIVQACQIHITDTALILSMMDVNAFKKFTLEYKDEQMLDYSPCQAKHYCDQDAKVIMQEICQCSNASDFQRLDTRSRNDAFKKMIAAGVMLRQAARLTGYSTTLIYKVIKE